MAASLALVLAVAACTKKEEKSKFPETPPDQVVLKFFSLLAQGGKLTLREAHQLLTDKFGPVDPDSFRKWVQEFEKDTQIRILETKLPEKKSKNGYFIAKVMMEIQTPSLFGQPFVNHSQMNLILDEKTNEWKIDFLAETIEYEEDFKAAPAEARVVE